MLNKKTISFLPVISIIIVLLLSALNVFIPSSVEAWAIKKSVSIGIGIIISVGLFFVKEKWIFKTSLPLYLVTVMVLVMQLFIGYNRITLRYVEVFNLFTICTSALLPLTIMQIAKMISEFKTVSALRWLGISFIAFVPILLVFFQSNASPVIVSIIVFLALVFLIKHDKKTLIPWYVLVGTTAVIVGILAHMGSYTTYLKNYLETIIERGTNDPEGVGWIRVTMDGILCNTPFIGESNYLATPKFSSWEIISALGDADVFVLLAKYGWLSFVGALIAYAIWFICIFKMVKNIKNNSFARYTSYAFAFSLLFQSVYSLIGFFVLLHPTINMPFVSGNYTINIVNVVSFGFIIMSYIRRNKEYQIPQAEDYKMCITELIFKKFKSYDLDEEI